MLGVSQGTINRAIRDLVDEGVVERFEGRGTFVAHDNSNRGFLWPSEAREWSKHPYPAAVLHAAEHEAHKRNKHILVGAVRDVTRPQFTGDGTNKVAGVMIIFNYDHEIVHAYHKRHIPVVLVDPLVRTTGIPFVTADHFSAAREATLHLARLGHKRIVHSTLDIPINPMPVEERVLGYGAAMRETDLQDNCHVHRTLLLETEHPASMQDAAGTDPAIEDFVGMLDRVQPTACFCYDDLLAASVLRICHNRGIRVPEDLSVVGINDSPLAAHLWPPLTTVHLPADEIGHTAVRMLDRLIEEDRLTGAGEILPVHLVERASTRGIRSVVAKGSSDEREQEQRTDSLATV
jgi:DNA-binding LacI/PurR family transcriptional regulator